MYLISLATILSFFLGIGLSASSGFKVFLPLFLIGFLSFLGIDFILISEDMIWIKNPIVLFVIGILTIIETSIYFIPFLDNRMDKFKIPLSFIVGAVIMKATLISFSLSAGWIISFVFGGGAAIFFSYTTAIARRITTITTRGAGNFLINVAEIFIALVLSITAIVISPLAFLITVILIIMMLIALNRLEKRIPNDLNHIVINVE